MEDQSPIYKTHMPICPLTMRPRIVTGSQTFICPSLADSHMWESYIIFYKMAKKGGNLFCNGYLLSVFLKKEERVGGQWHFGSRIRDHVSMKSSSLTRLPSKNNISSGVEDEKQWDRHQKPNPTKNVSSWGQISAISTCPTTVPKESYQ